MFISVKKYVLLILFNDIERHDKDMDLNATLKKNLRYNAINIL